MYALGGCRPTGVVLGNPLDGNTVAIHRVSDEDVRIRSPFYSLSGEEVQLAIGEDGFLDTVTHGSDVWTAVHDAHGMLTTLTDPLTRSHSFTYTTVSTTSWGGFLVSDSSPAGVVTRLSTADRPNSSEFTVHRILGSS